MNLLEIVQAATAEMALDRPDGVIGNTSPEVAQLFALLSRLSRDMCRQYDWQALTRECIVQTVGLSMTGTTVAGSNVVTVADTTGITTNYGVSGEGARPFSLVTAVGPTEVTMNMPAQTSGTGAMQFAQVRYPLPDDWRKQLPQTEWDRSNRWPLVGPQSPQAWQSFKSGIVYAGPRMRFRIVDGGIAVDPPPADGIIIAYEYTSNSYVRSAAGVPQQSFLADTDTTIFDPSLLIIGLITKFKQAKGLDVTFELGEFQGLMKQATSQDQSAPTISLSPMGGSILINTGNVKDGDWGVPRW